MTDDQYRGLLTDREREIIAGQADVSGSYHSRVVSRVRNKIEQLETDAEALERFHPELYEELCKSICETSG